VRFDFSVMLCKFFRLPCCARFSLTLLCNFFSRTLLVQYFSLILLCDFSTYPSGAIFSLTLLGDFSRAVLCNFFAAAGAFFFRLPCCAIFFAYPAAIILPFRETTLVQFFT